MLSSSPADDANANFLPGSLKKTSLGDILGTLYRAGMNGVLSLTENSGADHHVIVQRGRPTVVLSRGPALGEVLGSIGLVGEREIDRALDRASGGALFGDLLRAHGVRDTIIRMGLFAQARSRLDGLFRVRDAVIRFGTGAFVPAARAAGKGDANELPVEQFLHGRERARIRPPVPARTQALRALGLDEHADRQTIRRTFRKLVAELHPDLASSLDEKREREAKLVVLTKAYAEIV